MRDETPSNRFLGVMLNDYLISNEEQFVWTIKARHFLRLLLPLSTCVCCIIKSRMHPMSSLTVTLSLCHWVDAITTTLRQICSCKMPQSHFQWHSHAVTRVTMKVVDREANNISVVSTAKWSKMFLSPSPSLTVLWWVDRFTQWKELTLPLQRDIDDTVTLGIVPMSHPVFLTDGKAIDCAFTLLFSFLFLPFVCHWSTRLCLHWTMSLYHTQANLASRVSG